MSNQENDSKKQEALNYHSQGRPGKLEIAATKPFLTARDLSLAYSPGVAQPCLEIAKNPEDAYKYTAKGNLVAVISNGSAVLGLGNIGPLASKPVMEGKGILFKRFADIDVFDIEINEPTVEGMVSTIKALEPTFGGINLEDIKAPECFEVEEQLKEAMNIPVFHDDQHGTAIIATAAFLNALELTKKKINKVKIVFSGAGAASMAIAKLFYQLGVPSKNLFMCDSKGVIYQGRKDGMNKYKEQFAVETSDRTLTDVMKGADAFMGCSAKGVVSKEMVKSMAKDPIIFAMANPDPEIMPEEVAEVRDDAIMATGRTDYPNQVNNVLGFPFIFRGALDARATKINEEMKLAAVKALADLAKEDVPEDVMRAYGNEHFKFGKNYLIPKPFDKRVLTRLAPAVAKAAMDTGVAQVQIPDLKKYAQDLEARLGMSAGFMRNIRSRLPQKSKPRIVFTEAMNQRVLHAVSILREEGLINPILLGETHKIHARMKELSLEHLKDIEIVTPEEDERYEEFFLDYFKARQRKGASYALSHEVMKRHNYFGSMMVKNGYADGMITGATASYKECIKPILRVLGTRNKAQALGVIILIFKNKVYFLADSTVQIDPSPEELANIAKSTSVLYQKLMMKEPRVAFLSFSSFGSNPCSETRKIKKAVEITKERFPELIVDGEMQADVAVNHNIRENLFNFSTIDKDADVLIFPNLSASNISYKLLSQLGGATPIGPILAPMEYAVNIVQRTSTVEEIVNMSNMTALIALEYQKTKDKK